MPETASIPDLSGYTRVATRLDYLASVAQTIEYDEEKFAIYGDSHRATRKKNDDFQKNEISFLLALNGIPINEFTIVELGDIYELWEENSLEKIQKAYAEIEARLVKYRRVRLGGNHDAELRNPLAVFLKHRITGFTVFFTHGNAGDPFNDEYWKVGRFFTHYLWRPLQYLGLHDPTGSKIAKHALQAEHLKRWANTKPWTSVFGHVHLPFLETGNKYIGAGSWVGDGGQMAWLEKDQITLREYA